jgi:plastocyanin
MNKNIQSLLATVVLACLSQTSIAQTKFVYVSKIPGNKTSDNASSNMNGKITLISTDQRWTADKVYIVDKMVFVEEPAVLTIEPGTLVRFESNTKTGTASSINPNDPGAIIICRGAKIVAQGTADAPIIFTNLDDPFVPGGAATIPTVANGGLGKDTSTGYVTLTPRDYTSSAAGAAPRFSIEQEWGGLVMLGKARLAYGWADNQPSSSDSLVTPSIAAAAGGKGVNYIEGTSSIDGSVYGVSAATGYTFSGGLYGGTDDDDNSGSLRFMSLRFGGFLFAPDNELNGLTTGALGRNTSIEFVEVYNNGDDDFEPFGGRNHFRYIAGVCGGDDGFDIDQGYNGNVQFFAQLQGDIVFGNGDQTGREGTNEGDILGEWDGPEWVSKPAATSRSFPYSVPTMFNATHIGMGNDGITRKENSGGKVYNSIYINPTGLTITGGVLADAINGNDGTGSIHRLFVTRGSGGEYNESGITVGASEPDLSWKYTTFATISGSLTYAGLASSTEAQNKINSGNNNQVVSYTDKLTTLVRNLPTYTGTTTKMGAVKGGVGQRPNTPLVTPASPSDYYGSLDPRTGTDVDAGIRPSAAGPVGYAAKSGWFVETDFRGAFKDGNWLSGWSVLEDIGVAPSGGFATVAFPVPTVTRVVAGNIARVKFNTQSNVKYSVQTSEDSGKTFLPVHTATGLSNGLVTGSGSEATVDLAGKGSTKLLVRVMPL